MQRYQQALGQADDDTIVQQQKELMKAGMLCCLDMGKAFRAYRENVVNAQSAFAGSP